MDLRPGALVAGRYRVDQRVGAGGMGEVWAGEHVAVGTRIALKTMLTAAAVNHEVVARFRREAFLLGRVRSDHVARVIDFVADESFGLVLVMEFIDGSSLARVLGERTLSVEETVELGCDLAIALADLHRAHVVHRDLKPGNVILAPTTEGRTRAVLVDFGVSRLLSAGQQEEDTITGITRADMAVGTIEYMAPEQILNSRSVTGASDIYAVGAMLFRAVAGRHLFGDIQSESELAQLKLMGEADALPMDRRDRVGVGLRDVIARAVRRKPNDRFRSAEELAHALGPLRDLARMAALDLDSTTHDVHGLPFESEAKAPEPVAAPRAPAPAPAVAEPPRASLPSLPQAPPVEAPQPPPRAAGGVPVTVTALLTLLGLGTGLVGGALFLPRLSLDPAPAASASTAAAESSAPIQEPLAATAADDHASPIATASSTPSATPPLEGDAEIPEATSARAPARMPVDAPNTSAHAPTPAIQGAASSAPAPRPTPTIAQPAATPSPKPAPTVSRDAPPAPDRPNF